MPQDKNVFDILKERGFIAQTTDEAETRSRLDAAVTCYIGFDPTADSLHIGSLVPIMALVHMQRQGHRPIVLIGGGTGLVGDPSGKTEMRQLLTVEQTQLNAAALKAQLSHYLDFSDGRALMLNNADWLVELSYIGFLRDIGRHFSVNRMLAAESVSTAAARRAVRPTNQVYARCKGPPRYWGSSSGMRSWTVTTTGQGDHHGDPQ